MSTFLSHLLITYILSSQEQLQQKKNLRNAPEIHVSKLLIIAQNLSACNARLFFVEKGGSSQNYFNWLLYFKMCISNTQLAISTKCSENRREKKRSHLSSQNCTINVECTPASQPALLCFFFASTLQSDKNDEKRSVFGGRVMKKYDDEAISPPRHRRFVTPFENEPLLLAFRRRRRRRHS